MSLDNPSILKILDLSLSDYFFHPVDPKNGLDLSVLLPLCSLTLAFVLGEGDIPAFFDDDYWSLTFILKPKWLLCQEFDIN